MIWCDGALTDAAPPFDRDRGLTLGVGAFETMRFESGTIRRLSRHWARISFTLQALDLPRGFAQDDIDIAARALCQEAGFETAALRLTVTGGDGERGLAPPANPAPRWLLTAQPLVRPEGFARLMNAVTPRLPEAITSRHKTLSYLENVAARAEAAKTGCDEALLWTPSGHLACAAAANVCVFLNGVWTTPPVSDGALPGTTRAALIAQGTLVESRMNQKDFAAAEAIALTNALIGVRGATLHTAAETTDEARIAVRTLALKEVDAL
jgi:branched-chain amino acid aminotransferase